MSEAIVSYVDAKRAFAETLGASQALLHVHVGLLIFVLTAFLMRRRMASLWPLGIVVLFALLNETVDYLGPNRSAYWLSAGDVINTVIWPLVLFLLARRGSGVRTKV